MRFIPFEHLEIVFPCRSGDGFQCLITDDQIAAITQVLIDSVNGDFIQIAMQRFHRKVFGLPG